jgi:muconate cycloisomerase
MRIESIALRPVRIPFRRAFQHALANRTQAEAILVVVRSAAGTVGLGEIVPRPYVTGETVASVLGESGPRRAERYRGARFSSCGEVVAFLRGELACDPGDLATLGGFELAVLDVASRELGFALADVLGAPPGPELPPGAVIGFDVPTSELKKHCMLLRLTGKAHLKVKVGRADDLERLSVVSAAFGAGIAIGLDANAAWTASDAIEHLEQMKSRVSIAWVEQPVARDDLRGMRRVREETGLRVMADESLCRLADGVRLVEQQAADIFSIRLGKCGGFLGSLRLVELAKQSGIGLHLGSLVGETAVLSGAAEIFGRSVAGFACHEGRGQNRFLLRGDIAEVDPGAGGLGLSLREDWMSQFEATPEGTASAGTSSKEKTGT